MATISGSDICNHQASRAWTRACRELKRPKTDSISTARPMLGGSGHGGSWATQGQVERTRNMDGIYS